MSDFSFADRYAEAGIAPGAELIAAREAPAKRIQDNITSEKIFDLVGLYFDFPNLDLEWFRDEFIKEDASLSLINNRRECQILASAMLGVLLSKSNDVAILSILCGSMAAKRKPAEATWLLSMAESTLVRIAIAGRGKKKFETTIKSSQTPKLGEEISALPGNDWAALIAMLAKVRAEAQEAATTVARQASGALTTLKREVDLIREESQMLWWLFGEHSRSLSRHFGTHPPGQLAIIAAIDLGELTTVTRLGPIAAPAMLERVLRLARKERVAHKSLASAIDGLTAADLNALTTYGEDQPPRIFPIMTALEKAKANGTGSWHGAFKNAIGFEANTEFEPLELATQLYHEHLLGQLI